MGGSIFLLKLGIYQRLVSVRSLLVLSSAFICSWANDRPNRDILTVNVTVTSLHPFTRSQNLEVVSHRHPLRLPHPA